MHFGRVFVRGKVGAFGDNAQLLAHEATFVNGHTTGKAPVIPLAPYQVKLIVVVFQRLLTTGNASSLLAHPYHVLNKELTFVRGNTTGKSPVIPLQLIHAL